MSARQTAAEIIARWIETGDFPDRLLGSVRSDRPFITEIVLGVTRHKRLLEWAYGRFVNGTSPFLHCRHVCWSAPTRPS